MVLIHIQLPLAAQCANDQGKFWNFYDALYKNQGGENTGWADVDNLKKTFITNIWIEYTEV